MTNENTTGFNIEETMYEGINTNECEIIGMEIEDITKDEIIYYLEDGLANGMLDEIEEDVCYDIKLTGKCKKWKLEKVKKNIVEMYEEKF